ncbi:MAG: hypothetical protein ACD_73C00545G0001 [uncultured bacterium]|nr:MAG: hypothetical protein ACD_73C00545G0001 [uncultured bacterium]
MACLAVKALGRENVLGLIMPSRYTSPDSMQDASLLAGKLGIQTRIIPIDDIHKSYEASFNQMFAGLKGDTTEENIQARIRGNLLMAVSNKEGYLVLSTGNKSEVSVGYCTLYGDMAGGLSVISDVPKTMVYELCRFLNKPDSLIPERIFTKAPTAELKPDQTDQDSLPPYDILDSILRLMIEEQKSNAEIVKKGFKKDLVIKIRKMLVSSEYKRKQAAPGLKVTSKAFGVGRRFPIACGF